MEVYSPDYKTQASSIWLNVFVILVFVFCDMLLHDSSYTIALLPIC